MPTATSTQSKEFTNVTWTTDTYSDGTFRAYAWSTVDGSVIAEANGSTQTLALQGLHRQLCGWSKTSFACTLISSNGDRLTANG